MLLAPDQIRNEVPSAITLATLGRNPRITREQGKEAIEEFLALAKRLAIPFITADRKLYRLIRRLSYVVWIGDYSPDQGC